ncbi:MAG: flippase-like domain-containing protein [Rhodospirillaceae bacterium]|nr:flippase-like domain-containing protein [Rhodospirillaceae bacterium]MBT4464490.1 flippase-like domain-containing protein [Rhodospirillaceae bacterium]MBT5014732.1 flippase-like domain-containing protein [Rhodospirillaceae bacterium]MBT5309438.1 flippase-like domain-containing protein [Rhodospirillaceae bacterium]MBT6407175.1 flippase-like domain-containing protein [Rhodospirillaceae bacterium]
MNKKTIALIVKFAISGGLIWYLLDNVDLSAAKDKLLTADIGFLALAGIAIVVQVVICVYRWLSVMRAIDADMTFSKTLQIYMIGFFFNQALPSSVGGDGVRMYKAYKNGLSLSGAVNGVMLERVATVLALVIVVVVATPFFIDRVGDDAASWIVPAVSILGLGGVAGLVLLMGLDRLPSRFDRWRVVRGMAVLAADARRVFFAPADTMRVMGWSLTGHVNVSLAVFLLARSLDLDVSWLDCLVLMPPVLLIMTLPISIAGWGVREGAMVTAFGLIGVSAAGALVLSVMFGLWALVMGLPGGVVWLMSQDRTIEDIETPMEAR